MRARILLAGMIVAAVAWGVLAAGCKSEPQEGSKPGTAAVGWAGKGEIAQKLCPVTGEPINPKIFIDYDGRRIYFCCDMCPPMFKKDPEKYLKKLDEQMKSGAAAPGAGAKALEAAVPAAAGEAVVYTCPMHPDVKSDKPGKCPKCGMALVPAKETK
ncbi:MAG: YHS domain-containing protein [Planctomycetota bacterium]|nr:YHS domain-containing protein [Planctomycetota bacterium]